MSPVTAAAPVTVVVSRRARPGREAELEGWLRGVTEAAAAFPGHLGAEVVRPDQPDAPGYVLVFRFASRADLHRWNTSAVRAEWLAGAEPLTEGRPVLQAVSGLEGWFALPGRPVVLPPRWKTALVTGTVIYVLVCALTLVAGGWLARLPLPLRTALTTLCLVSLMTWAVMPAATRLLHGWLYPRPPGATR